MNMIMNLTTFFKAILSWIILGESLAGIQYLGMAIMDIMVVGLAFIQLGKPDSHPLRQVEGSF